MSHEDDFFDDLFRIVRERFRALIDRAPVQSFDSPTVEIQRLGADDPEDVGRLLGILPEAGDDVYLLNDTAIGIIDDGSGDSREFDRPMFLPIGSGSRRQRTIGPVPTVQATPSGTFPGAGISPTVDISGTDDCGTVELIRGTSSASGNIWRVVFSTARQNANYVVMIQAASLNARALTTHISDRSVSGFTLAVNAGGTGGDTVNFQYDVTEWRNT